jgi:hypothetical protein
MSTPVGNYQPTMETVLGKLDRPGALFTGEEVEVMVTALEALTAESAKQAREITQLRDALEHIASPSELSGYGWWTKTARVALAKTAQGGRNG